MGSLFILVAGNLVEMDNPCMRARVIVDSVDVVSRLEAIFVCLDPHD